LLLGVVVDRGFKPLTLDLIKVRASTMPGADKVEELYLSMQRRLMVSVVRHPCLAIPQKYAVTNTRSGVQEVSLQQS
jgi:hypothetical protein